MNTRGRKIVGSSAVQPLVKTLEEADVPDPLVVWTLGEIGREASGAADLLARILRTGRSGLRRRAATALGKIGPATTTGVAALRDATMDRDQHVRLAAIEALQLIEGKRMQLRARSR